MHESEAKRLRLREARLSRYRRRRAARQCVECGAHSPQKARCDVCRELQRIYQANALKVNWQRKVRGS